MKKFAKILAVALAVFMLMITSVTAFAEYPETDAYTPETDFSLSMDEWVKVGQEGGAVEEYQFVASESGWYVLNTASYDDDTDPYIYIMDAYGEEIASGDDSAYCSYDCEVWFYAEKSETYYIYISNFNYEYVEFDVWFEAENDGSHIYCWDDDWDGYCDWCDYQICEHKCHNNGFFWRITNFFNRLFGINERCECGVWHW